MTSAVTCSLFRATSGETPHLSRSSSSREIPNEKFMESYMSAKTGCTTPKPHSNPRETSSAAPNGSLFLSKLHRLAPPSGSPSNLRLMFRAMIKP